MAHNQSSPSLEQSPKQKLEQSTEQNLEHIFTLTGIDCPSCAARIESALEAQPHTQSASFDFATNRLYLTTSNLPAALQCVKKIEPNSVLTPLSNTPLSNTPSHTAQSSTRTQISESHANSHAPHNAPAAQSTSANQSTDEPSELPQLIALLCGFALCMGLLYIPSLAQILNPLLLPLFSPLLSPLSSHFLESTLATMQPAHALSYAALLIIYLIAGKPIFLATYKNAKNKIFFDENTLMFVATLAALCLGEVSEAVAVMLFFRLGEFIEGRALAKSKASINALLAIMPDIAHKISPSNPQAPLNAQIIDCRPEELQKGDMILVKVGEKVPTDGVITKGKSYLDMRSINGESTPVSVESGSSIIAGAINTHAVLEVRVTSEFQNSHIAKIAALTQSASANKAKTQKIITRFAQIYTPIIFVLALLLAIVPPLLTLGFPHIFGDIFGVGLDFARLDSELSESSLSAWALWHEWIYRALVVLMISCPCALVISVPLGYFAALGNASSKGALFKGSIHLESLAQTKNIFFDKTGTLTMGSFEILELYPKGISKEQLLTLASCAEAHSSHPIATCITSTLPNTYNIESYEEKSGMGVIVELGQSQALTGQILCGNDKLMNAYKVEGFAWDLNLPHSIIHIAHNGVYVGSIAIGDKLKIEAKEAIAALKAQGVENFAILSGDRQESVDYIARELGISHAYGELLPAQKYEILTRLKAQWAKENGGKSAFVGDGINDCVVLKGADVGISINTGDGGNDISKESADIILQSPSLHALSHALHIAKRTKFITWQNISFALGSKLILVLLGICGIANMWLAVFGDVGIALLAMLNAKRGAR